MYLGRYCRTFHHAPLSYVKYIMCPSQFHLSSVYGRRCWTISSPGRSRACPFIHEEQRHVCGGLGGSAIRLSTLPETATARRWRSDGGAARVLCNGLYHFYHHKIPPISC